MILKTSTFLDLEKVLLIAVAPKLREQFETFLPSVDIAVEDNLLSGLVRVNSEKFEVIIIHVVRNDSKLASAVRSLKKVSGSSKIILISEMLDEPISLDLVRKGIADDYLVLPMRSDELNVSIKRFASTSTPQVRETNISAKQYPRFMDMENGEIECIDSGQAIVKELAELISASHRGLNSLLEQVCWSAVFLFRVSAAKITVGDQIVCVGQSSDNFGHSISLLEDGQEIGKLELASDGSEIVNPGFADYLEQLIPGLIRMASSYGELQELATIDPLTGLANRRHLMDTLEALISRAKSERFRITLVLFDFDNFKHYNDTYGHGAGDEILHEAGMLIKQCIRRQDLAARFGGDEIAVVLWDAKQRRSTNSEHPRSAMAIMERFRKLLKSHCFSRLGAQMQGSLTISAGLASFPWDANDAEELIERADGALLEAKRSGKDRVYLVGQAAENVTD